MLPGISAGGGLSGSSGVGGSHSFDVGGGQTMTNYGMTVYELPPADNPYIAKSQSYLLPAVIAGSALLLFIAMRRR